MRSTNIRQTFALNNEGIITSIRDVQRGLSCNCTCPSCNTNLIAKQGKKREWHFAHRGNHNCINGAESSLHLAAKQVVASSPKILISNDEGKPEYLYMDSSDLEMQWDTHFGKVIPDVTVTSGAERYFIEIIVTNSINEKKREKLHSLGLPTLLIYLDPSMMAEWSWAGIKENIIDEHINRQWLPQSETKADPIYEAPDKPAEKFDRQTSLVIENVQVTVRRYEWFVTVKSMYDTKVNKLLISMSHKFNGYWNSVYKTCTYPRAAFKLICEHLSKLSSKQMF